MSFDQLLCDSTESTLTPMSLVLRLAKSSLRFAKSPSSVVHTGVKSAGWENRIPQLSPRYSYRLMVPSVLSAVKFGAASPSCSAIFLLLLIFRRDDSPV